MRSNAFSFAQLHIFLSLLRSITNEIPMLFCWAAAHCVCSPLCAKYLHTRYDEYDLAMMNPSRYYLSSAGFAVSDRCRCFVAVLGIIQTVSAVRQRYTTANNQRHNMCVHTHKHTHQVIQTFAFVDCVRSF